jgi:outer membrane autotransporter protein
MGVTLGAMQTTLRTTVGWRHAFGNVTPSSTFALDGSSYFGIAGVPIAKDALVLEAGLDMKLSDRATLGVAYNGQFGGRTTDQGLRGTFNWKF